MTEKGLPGKKARISGTENEWMFTAYLGKDANGKQKRVRHRFKNTKQGEEATEREADYEFRAWLNQMEKEIINPPKKARNTWGIPGILAVQLRQANQRGTNI